ncbi:MAG: endonuclease MutS2 [Chloroflexi bacterium]|nr:endonuclease MutS2 [Chloroflexota bacterium]
MDAKSQALLEFPLIRARLAGHASFAPSRRLAEGLSPSSDAFIVARALDETDQTRALLSERPDVGVGGARDIGPALERAARGGRLEASELLDITATLIAAGRLQDALREDRRPLLHELARRISPLPALRNRLELSLDPAGELLDSASPALGGLRRAVRIAYERLRSRLEDLVHRSDMGSALQEPIVTLRNGRYVVPVRSDSRGKVKGIVHDQSGSGQTLFVEPLVAVELGNVWREAQLSAQAEEERILDELSALVGSQAGPLRDTLDALARFDLWAAKARLAAEMDAVRAETAERHEVELFAARHPGLTGRVVPTDLRLGGPYTALVITGPNTGGKTVALRTLGLLSLMHQAGLHVPVSPGSRLPVFRDVFADIGDEQSVAQSLSTFSGHLRSIVRIVQAAGPGCPVLLDELGAGTDPTEGSALAQALLDHFIRAGALVAATSHYAELKVYAHDTPEARNASVEFDLETLSPTYRLTIGLPGTSQAFAIAERLGLAAGLVDDARSRLSRAQLDFEATLASIKASEATTAEALLQAEEAEARARRARSEAEQERLRARREREEAVQAARSEADAAVSVIRGEIEATRAILARETLTEARLDEAIRRLEERISSLPIGGHAEQAAEVPVAPAGWQLGMRALTPAGLEGRIVSLESGGRRATLEAGGMRVTADVGDLRAVAQMADSATRHRAGDGPEAHQQLASDGPVTGRRGDFGAEGRAVPTTIARSPSRPGGALAAPRTVASSLDLRGARVEEALELLERYIDQAAAAEAGRVTVIHGHGTGALRDSVREHLTSHPLVREWRAGERGEGGDGATIVSL